MSRRSGFTLIEIVIAIFILLLILGLAVPSLTGVLADKRLHGSLDRFNTLVRTAHERSLAERRPYLIVWTDRDVRLQPALPLKNEPAQPIDTIPFDNGEHWRLDFPAALTSKTPAEWMFWESGVCEPVRVHFNGPEGTWTAQYAPLSGLADIIAYAPR